MFGGVLVQSWKFVLVFWATILVFGFIRGKGLRGGSRTRGLGPPRPFHGPNDLSASGFALRDRDRMGIYGVGIESISNIFVL